VELDLRDSGLTFSWPCSRVRAALGEVGGKAGAPTPCSPDELAAFAKLLEGQEIPEAKIWLSAGLSAFLFLYTSTLGLLFFCPDESCSADICPHIIFDRCGWLCSCAAAGLGRRW